MSRPKLKEPNYKLVLDKKSGIWMVSWTDPETGRTRKKTTRQSNQEHAERVKPSIIAEIRTPSSAYTVGELLIGYACQLDPKKQSAHYAVASLRKFFDPYEPHQLNDAAWNNYRTWRTEQSVRSAAPIKKLVADSTAVRELRILAAALKWGQRNGWDGLDGKKVHLPESKYVPRQDYLTIDDAQRLLNSCTSVHQCLFIRIAIATGARMSAILDLKWENVLWPPGTREELDRGPRATVRSSIALIPKTIFSPMAMPEPPRVSVDRNSGVTEFSREFGIELPKTRALRFDLGNGSGNKRRGTGVISLENKGLYDDLAAAYRERQSDHVIEWRGKRIDKIDLSPVYRRAGIEKKAKQHILKHTCCSWLVQAGQSYVNISKLVGTTANVIESTYGHMSPSHLETVGSTLSI